MITIYHGTVRITAPGGLQRAKESLVYVKRIPYSHLSELGTLSPRGCLEVAHLLVLKTVRRREGKKKEV